MSDYDSDDSLDQLDKIRNADIKPGMFVSGWEDPNDEIEEDKNPHGMKLLEYFIESFVMSQNLFVFYKQKL